MTLLNRGNLAANESPPPTGGVGPVGVIIIIVEEQVEGYGKEGRSEGVERSREGAEGLHTWGSFRDHCAAKGGVEGVECGLEGCRGMC
jgi:hypothetical protein